MTMRQLDAVIKNKYFCKFILKMFRIDPNERASAKELLVDKFIKKSITAILEFGLRGKI